LSQNNANLGWNTYNTLYNNKAQLLADLTGSPVADVQALLYGLNMALSPVAFSVSHRVNRQINTNYNMTGNTLTMLYNPSTALWSFATLPIQSVGYNPGARREAEPFYVKDGGNSTSRASQIGFYGLPRYADPSGVDPSNFNPVDADTLKVIQEGSDGPCLADGEAVRTQDILDLASSSKWVLKLKGNLDNIITEAGFLISACAGTTRYVGIKFSELAQIQAQLPRCVCK